MGTRLFKAIFTPTDTSNYTTVEKDVNITVEKANPAYTVPESLSATYEHTLKDVKLPTPAAGRTPGSWKWAKADSISVGTVGTHDFTATFTPTDTRNYNSASSVTFKVVVSPQPATDPGTPSAGEIVYSPTQTFADVTPPTGWVWADGTVKPTAPVTSYAAYYEISDNVNYDWSKIQGYDSKHSRIERSLQLNVKKANPSSEPGDLTAFWGQILSDIELPTLEEGDWIWDSPSTSVGNAGSTYQYSARFIPNDGDNYNIVQKILNVTVEKATSSLPEGLSAIYGKKLGDVEFNQPNIGA